jgi:hypothetical protein
MKHIFLSIACLLLTANIVKGQYTISASGGLSGLKYQTEGGSQSIGMGYGGGISYFFFIGTTMHSFWQIGTGLEYSVSNSKVSFDRLFDSYKQGDDTDKSLFSYSLDKYEEQHSIAILSLPVMFRYATGRRFNLIAGLKFGLPVNAKAKIAPGRVSASGAYDYEGETYTDLPQHGFPEGTILPETQSKINLGFSTTLVLETGLSFRKFYAGVYFDYGLNNIQKVNDKHVVEYRNSSSLVHNSILNTGLVDKINIYNAGLKLKVWFYRFRK